MREMEVLISLTFVVEKQSEHVANNRDRVTPYCVLHH